MSMDIRQAQKAFDKAVAEDTKVHDTHIKLSRAYRAGNATWAEIEASDRRILAADKAYKKALADLERAKAQATTVVINNNAPGSTVGIQAASVNGRSVWW
ncbi:hypothetical protein [Promicromonospora sukumoe]